MVFVQNVKCILILLGTNYFIDRFWLMCKNYLLIIIFVFVAGKLLGQDVSFSQFYSSPTQTNPAFCGDKEYPRLALNYRNHIPALNSTFVSYSVFYDQYIEFIKGGIGVHTSIDQAGDYRLLNIGGSNSYTIKLNKKYYLKSGFQYDMVQNKISIDNPGLLDEEDFSSLYKISGINFLKKIEINCLKYVLNLKRILNGFS